MFTDTEVSLGQWHAAVDSVSLKGLKGSLSLLQIISTGVGESQELKPKLNSSQASELFQCPPLAN